MNLFHDRLGLQKLTQHLQLHPFYNVSSRLHKWTAGLRDLSRPHAITRTHLAQPQFV